MKKQLALSEGNVFLVPLSVGFAVGVLVRFDGRGRAYGVFFAPRRASKEEVVISELKPEDGCLRFRFGDHGLYTGRWPVIGRIPLWNREQWALPKFWRSHDDINLCYITEYDDKLDVCSEIVGTKSDADALPYDAQYGSAIIESKLEKLLK